MRLTLHSSSLPYLQQQIARSLPSVARQNTDTEPALAAPAAAELSESERIRIETLNRYLSAVFHLQLVPSTSTSSSTTKIIPLHMFNSLRELELTESNALNICGISVRFAQFCGFQMSQSSNLFLLQLLRPYLQKLHIRSNLSELRSLLASCLGDNSCQVDTPWSKLVTLSISHCNLLTLDESIRLVPNLEELDLSHNQLQSVEWIQDCVALTKLNLNHNRISDLSKLHGVLGNISILSLKANGISSLVGLEKLYSLQVFLFV
jgi:Leucine-rich repeat (LRR) protein